MKSSSGATVVHALWFVGLVGEGTKSRVAYWATEQLCSNMNPPEDLTGSQYPSYVLCQGVGEG